MTFDNHLLTGTWVEIQCGSHSGLHVWRFVIGFSIALGSPITFIANQSTRSGMQWSPKLLVDINSPRARIVCKVERDLVNSD